MAYICEPYFANMILETMLLYICVSRVCCTFKTTKNLSKRQTFLAFFIAEVVFQAFCLVAHTLSEIYILELPECRSQTTKD